jgi:flagellar hook-associated protein 2
VNDATGSRLALVANNSGAANDFSITNDSGLQFTQAAAGKNASLTVDGIPISSAGNTVTGVVNGLTLNLLGAAPQTEIDVSIAPDATDASQAITNFVNAYNTAIQDVNTQFAYSASSSSSGPLAGDSTMFLLQNDLLSAVGYQASGSGALSTLQSLGISMNNDGTLTVDSSALNNALQNDFSAVQNFFQGASSNGFATALNNELSSLTDPVNGAFTVDLNSINSTISDLQGQINDFQTYISAQQTYLTNEYSQAEIALQELPEQEQQLQAELGNSSGSNK